MPDAIPNAHRHTDARGHTFTHAHVHAATHLYVLERAHPLPDPALGEPIQDPNGDELEHGAADYPGQFPASDPIPEPAGD